MPFGGNMGIQEAETALDAGSEEKRREAIAFLSGLSGDRALDALIDRVLCRDGSMELRELAANRTGRSKSCYSRLGTMGN